ncbi:hypothetical protein CSUB_C1361 [Candidatus Caldarchaeum subterraneum]|uniref:Uncharacterized protein n=2 Tax=Thermoproteati TaxID=1783275 RepID=H5SNR5_9CREN|nr:hypothetical protein HGMM_F50B05C12 [Candidatus Caldarchaeum subterraneum]BAJ49647.1 hypothetical protein HGMM_F53G09C41 [Candidatus Caldarchaeum subterraneum]BAJ51212.1 hypothetical protein CSUB_C1361 [Candidatus Caldarchaeum subterraneum]BAL57801.1 hypothetical protein HGMM_F52D10C31 [uncultured crenarchaeote]GBC72556.1 hypothetical protein HRbin03_00387 [archaeon HR03]
MTQTRILFVILSGPNDFEKARQGLRIARNIAKEKIATEVKLLFVGPGTTLLDPDNQHYDIVKHYATELNQAGARCTVCAGNLRVYKLEEKIDKNLFIADDSTAVVAEAALNGFTILTF